MYNKIIEGKITLDEIQTHLGISEVKVSLQTE